MFSNNTSASNGFEITSNPRSQARTIRGANSQADVSTVRNGSPTFSATVGLERPQAADRKTLPGSDAALRRPRAAAPPARIPPHPFHQRKGPATRSRDLSFLRGASNSSLER